MSQFPGSSSMPPPPPYAGFPQAGASSAAGVGYDVPLDGLAYPPDPITAGDLGVLDQPHVDLVTGYLVSVIHLWTQPAATPARGGRAPAPKKGQVVKSDRMQLDSMSRYDLAVACLSLHNLEDEYRASKACGFGFKMWWTGSSGGKSAAATIETDAEYELLRTQLLASKKNANAITVFISFDTDEMDAFRRLRKRVDVNDHMEGSFVLGTKVPRLANMDTPSQLHGDIILKLKDTHPCEKHRGEHGEPGYCYVTPDGSHIGMNNRRLAIWAAAIAAGDATRFVPPNVAEFDGPQGLGATVSKPRGRGPAHPAPPSATSPASSDASAVLMAAMVPLLMSLTQSVMPRAGLAPPMVPPLPVMDAPAAALPCADSSESEEPGVATGFMFLPTHTLECLLAFKEDTGINIVEKAAALDHRDLTPDLIPEVPHDHLAGVLGVSEGKALKFQLFCRQWAKNFSRKQKAVE